MERRIANILRIVILALMIQIFCPLFVNVVIDRPVTSGKAVIQAKHHAVSALLLFKEKEEESEERNENNLFHLVQLIDFTEHTAILENSLAARISPADFEMHLNHRPPLCTLHSVFLL